MGKQLQDLHMKVRQWLVTGRQKPTETNPAPQVYAMRVFAPNAVLAKSRFWVQVRFLNKIKRAVGEVLSVNEIFEKTKNSVKTYGIALKYQSRTNTHNIYKEFRDTSLNGAVSQLHMEMSGNHRTFHPTIRIMRTAILEKTADIKKSKSKQFRDSNLKFPVLKSIVRASQRKFRTVFSATRPNTFRA